MLCLYVKTSPAINPVPLPCLPESTKKLQIYIFSPSAALDVLTQSLQCHFSVDHTKSKTVKDAEVYKCLFYKRRAGNDVSGALKINLNYGFFFNTVGMVRSLKRQQNREFIVQIKIICVQRKINVKDQLDTQKSECRG